MKRCVAVLAVLAIALSASADDRVVKRDLIREILAAMDAKALTQSTLDIAFQRLEKRGMPTAEMLKQLSDDERKMYETEMKKQSEQLRVYRERLYSRIDYAKYAEEVYAPIFDKNFSIDELKELAAFYKTTAGQKTARSLPEFTLGGVVRGAELLAELGRDIQTEIENEENAKKPWKKTMSDLRTVATATEAYATDANKYPEVHSYDGLGTILSPTYIRQMPEKDAWGTPFKYVVSSDGQHYRFVSAGADRKFDWNAEQFENVSDDFEGRASENLNDDIVFQDGLFVQYPSVSEKDY